MAKQESPKVLALDGIACRTATWCKEPERYLTVVVEACFQLNHGGRATISESNELPLPTGPSHDAPFLPAAEVSVAGSMQTGRLQLYAEDRLLDLALPLQPHANALSGETTPAGKAPHQLDEDGSGARIVEAAFDWNGLHAVPATQRIRFLRGDEWIALEGGPSEHVHLRSQLPDVSAMARVACKGAAALSVDMVADRLHVDMDNALATVGWRGNVALPQGVTASAMQIWSGLRIGNRHPSWPIEAQLALAASGAEDAAEKPGRTANARTITLNDLFHDEASMPKSMSVQAATTAADTVRMGDLLEASETNHPARPSHRDRRAVSPSAAPAQPPPTQSANATISMADLLDQSDRSNPSAGPTVTLDSAQHAEAQKRSALPFSKSSSAAQAVAPFAASKKAGSQAQRPVHAVSPWARSVPAPPPAPVGDHQVTLALGDLIETPTAPSPAPTSQELLRALPLKPRRGLHVPTVLPDGIDAITLPWQLRPPRHSLTVVAKQSFRLESDGNLSPLTRAAAFCGEVNDGEQACPRYPSDFAFFKPRADVVLAATAYPPLANARASEVLFRFGPKENGFERRLLVIGEREWRGRLLPSPSEPEAFSPTPLTWENAFGGPGFIKNPAGRGYLNKSDDNSRANLLPLLENPKQLLESKGKRPEPICFAPLPMHWHARWRHRGTYGRRWHQTRWPFFPEDFGWSFFQSAPAEQQLAYLRGDEPFELRGVLAEGATIRGRLPGMRQRCFQVSQSHTKNGDEQRDVSEIALRLDTVVFDSNAMRVDLVWRGLIESAGRGAPEVALLIVASERPNQRLHVEDVLAQALQQLAPSKEAASPQGSAAPDAVANDIATPSTVQSAKAAEAATAEDPAKAPPSEATAAKKDEGGGDPQLPEGELWQQLGVPAYLQAMKRAQAPGFSKEHIAWVERSLSKQHSDLMALAQKHGLPRPPTLDGADTAANAASETDADFADRLTQQPPAAEADKGQAEASPIASLLQPGAQLAGRDFRDQDLRGSRLAGADLSGAILDGCNISDADLSNANLQGASLVGCDLTASCLSGANLSEATLAACLLDDVDLSDSQAKDANFRKAKGAHIAAQNANFRGARFDEASLVGIRLIRAQIDGAHFDKADLTRAVLIEAQGADAFFSEATLRDAQCDGANLPGAQLEGCDASGSTWENADLAQANLAHAAITTASFVRSRCRKANFNHASGRNARFDEADLRQVTALKADIMRASCEGTDLREADFRGANLHGVASWRARLEGLRLDLAITTQTQIGDAR